MSNYSDKGRRQVFEQRQFAPFSVLLMQTQTVEEARDSSKQNVILSGILTRLHLFEKKVFRKVSKQWNRDVNTRSLSHRQTKPFKIQCESIRNEVDMPLSIFNKERPFQGWQYLIFVRFTSSWGIYSSNPRKENGWTLSGELSFSTKTKTSTTTTATTNIWITH